MGTKKKLRRFEESKSFDNYFQPTYPEVIAGFPLKGKWNTDYFKNKNPICLELGCGKGEYTIALARKYPERNFVGIDIKGARTWKGCKIAIEENLQNVAFIRSWVELIEHFFAPNEVAEIWITHPDPQPRQSKAKKRLTSPQFLRRYAKILQKNAIIHLKTDDTDLFEYTLEVVQENNAEILFQTADLYAKNPEKEDVMLTQTFYEKQFLAEGKTIKYLRFKPNFD